MALVKGKFTNEFLSDVTFLLLHELFNVDERENI